MEDKIKNTGTELDAPVKESFLSKHKGKIIATIIGLLLYFFANDIRNFIGKDGTVIPINDSIGIEIDTVLLDSSTLDSLHVK